MDINLMQNIHISRPCASDTLILKKSQREGLREKRGKGVFDEYVKLHYADKLNAKDVLSRNIAKLLLNSLYGKFGMKEIDSVLKVVSTEQADKIAMNYNYDFIAPLNP